MCIWIYYNGCFEYSTFMNVSRTSKVNINIVCIFVSTFLIFFMETYNYGFLPLTKNVSYQRLGNTFM